MPGDSALAYAAAVSRSSIVAVGLLLAAATAAVVGAYTGAGAYEAPLLLLAAATAYVVGVAVPPRAAAAVTVAAAAALTWANQVRSPAEYSVSNDLFFFLMVVGGPALAGAATGGRARQVRELRRLAGQVARQRAAEVRAARMQERHRLEVSLHRGFSEQVVAIGVRAEGAQQAPADEARQALADIEDAARRALEELRGALGVLRERSEEPAPVLPAGPGELPRSSPPDRLTLPDLALAAGSGLALAVESPLTAAATGPVWANVLVGLLVGTALLWRRVRPVAVAVTVVLLLLVMSWWLTPPSELVTVILPVVVCAYAVATGSRRAGRVAGLGVVAAGIAVVGTVGAGSSWDAGGLLAVEAWVLLAFGLGLVASGWAVREAQQRAALAELERGRTVELELAMAEQRSRTARDLHDTVAHAMTVVCLQSSAGQVRDGDVDDVLRSVLETSRRSLRELQHGLEGLGDPDALDAEELAAEARRAGVFPEVHVTGRLDELPPPVRELAVRIVREALVNAGRYAAGARVRIELEVGDRMSVAVTDDGGARTAWQLGAGAGLEGLASDVARLGGDLRWGPLGPGFRLVARLPLTGVLA